MDTQPVIAWWYADGDKPRGPLDDDALASLFQEGRVSLQTEVWHEGMKTWSSIASVPRLYERLTPGSRPASSMPARVSDASPAQTPSPRIAETSGNWLWQISLALAIVLILTGALGLVWTQWRSPVRQEALQERHVRHVMPALAIPSRIQPPQATVTFGDLP